MDESDEVEINEQIERPKKRGRPREAEYIVVWKSSITTSKGRRFCGQPVKLSPAEAKAFGDKVRKE